MAFDFHKNSGHYFNIQAESTEGSIVPFLEELVDFSMPLRILEIGSHLGGNLVPFAKQNHSCVGVEIVEEFATISRHHIYEAGVSDQITIIHDDINSVSEETLGDPFDIIMLRDTIEHIENKPALMEKLMKHLNPGGVVFFSFPPWYMPFGGHQQGADSRFLCRGIWLHLLPTNLWSKLIKKCRETPEEYNYLMECKSRGITIEQFEKLIAQSGLSVRKKQAYFSAPIYKFKFGIPELKQPSILQKIPFFRNFYTTSSFYLLEKPSV